jgi:hypothetical protein
MKKLFRVFRQSEHSKHSLHNGSKQAIQHLEHTQIQYTCARPSFGEYLVNQMHTESMKHQQGWK